VYASGNGKPYSHEYVLNSIFWQEYQNYAVVYVADGHLSSEVEIIKQFLTKKESGKSIIFVWNSEKQFFLKSVLQASRDHCSKKKVTTLIDGDD
jgi:glycosyltransferase involved in cell wall biosynthesis